MDCSMDARWGAALVLLALTGCSELHEDTGRACVMPHDIVCDCSEGEPCGPQNAVWNSEIVDCEGLYEPADNLEVEVVMRDSTFVPTKDEQCSVELIDDAIVVEASFRERTAYHYYSPGVVVRCTVPPLEPGVWRLVYRGEELSFLVGEDEPQAMACIGTAL